MKVLFIGDVVGKRGREALSKHLPMLKEKYCPDFIIANGENSAHGKGITKKIYQSFVDMGIDVITMGNHTFSNDNLYTFIDEADHLITPANRDIDKPGKHAITLSYEGKKVVVYNLSGKTFMDDHVVEEPIPAMEKLLKEYPGDIHIVDLHGEATSEKAAFLHYYYDRVQMIVGTHTHIQTADEDIYHGCAFITDVGMCGGYDSIIGRDSDEVLERLTTGRKTHFIPADTPGIFCGVVVTFDMESLKATHIERIQIRPEM